MELVRERQLISLRIEPDLSSVKAKFKETVIRDIPEGQEGAENIVSVRYFESECTERPHKDLSDAIKKLRRHGMAILGIELHDEARTIKAWTVTQIKISGDMVLEQSRVSMKLALKVESTGKVSEIDVPQVAMYPKEEAGKYHDIQKLTVIIEDIVEEVWSYLFEGKFETGTNGQLALFPNHREALTPEKFMKKLEKEKAKAQEKV